ncbi:hypothetical protein [Streptomyces brevispora]|uniref:Uncharacterized protein n=1 Tax=Streptomyces brevispora TaxID=887462 RepID=A0A561TYC2_9ACTN|nr:hypothetical protein [Streptomyces brevispora]TWF92123.1 hypothetical protein FHX80_12442 [Streptomyces brevispora]WSC11572.1 hypothetical protein OIE64_00875 [Streptomyces brevispora]WSC17539.1 hypothetical protein OIE64_35165 [Streptomyces brevispora]
MTDSPALPEPGRAVPGPATGQATGRAAHTGAPGTDRAARHTGAAPRGGPGHRGHGHGPALRTAGRRTGPPTVRAAHRPGH